MEITYAIISDIKCSSCGHSSSNHLDSVGMCRAIENSLECKCHHFRHSSKCNYCGDFFMDIEYHIKNTICVPG